MSSREPAHPEELLLLDYVIGQLPAETRDQIKRHVAACRACSRTIDDLILTVDELDRLPTMPIPHDSPADLRPPRIRPKSRIRWFVPVLGVVLLALLALVTFGGGRNPKPKTVQTVGVAATTVAEIQSVLPSDDLLFEGRSGSYVVLAKPSDVSETVKELQKLPPGTTSVVVVTASPGDVNGLFARAAQAR